MIRHPLTLGLLLALNAAPVLAQAQSQVETQDKTTDDSSLETVVVTGTRTSTRTVATSPSPIDVITPAALEATGTTELANALSRALPSLNFPRPAITDGTDAVRPAQLRGLAPDQVLVLVNGKRRHTTALINLNGKRPGLAGLSELGRNLSLFDPESAYRMMTDINSRDVNYKAQFSELTGMGGAVSEMQKAGQDLVAATTGADNASITSAFEYFSAATTDEPG